MVTSGAHYFLPWPARRYAIWPLEYIEGRWQDGAKGSFLMRVLLLALMLGLAASPAVAQSSPPPQLTGTVKAPLPLDETTLKSLPATELDITFKSGAATETGHYTGVLLWSLLEKAGLVNGPGKNAVLRHTLLVTGSDNYAAALAEGEIDPGYAGKQVILAYEGGAGGKVNFDHLRLLVPGDDHGGRSVSDVVSIEVK